MSATGRCAMATRQAYTRSPSHLTPPTRTRPGAVPCPTPSAVAQASTRAASSSSPRWPTWGRWRCRGVIAAAGVSRVTKGVGGGAVRRGDDGSKASKRAGWQRRRIIGAQVRIHPTSTSSHHPFLPSSFISAAAWCRCVDVTVPLSSSPCGSCSRERSSVSTRGPGIPFLRASAMCEEDEVHAFFVIVIERLCLCDRRWRFVYLCQSLQRASRAFVWSVFQSVIGCHPLVLCVVESILPSVPFVRTGDLGVVVAVNYFFQDAEETRAESSAPSPGAVMPLWRSFQPPPLRSSSPRHRHWCPPIPLVLSPSPSPLVFAALDRCPIFSSYSLSRNPPYMHQQAL